MFLQLIHLFTLTVTLKFTHTLTQQWKQATMQGAGTTIRTNLLLSKDTLPCGQTGQVVDRTTVPLIIRHVC